MKKAVIDLYKEHNKVSMALLILEKVVVELKIEKKFEVLEREVVGGGKHETYDSWLNQLKAHYPGMK